MRRGAEFLPYIKMKNSGYANVGKYSDGSSNLDGILYPDSSYTSQINNATNLGGLRDFLHNMYQVSLPSTTANFASSLANNAYARFIAPQYFNKYKELLYMKVASITKGQQDSSAALSNIAANYPGMLHSVEIDSTRMFHLYIRNDNTTWGVVTTRDATTNVITWGIPVQVYSSNPSNVYWNFTDLILLGTNKVLAYINGNDLYCCSITGTGSSATFTVSTTTGVKTGAGSVTRLALKQVDVDKALIIESENNNTVYARLVTYSGTTATLGTGVAVDTSSVFGEACVLSTTQALYTYGKASDFRGVILSFSGTTITVNTSVVMGAYNTMQDSTLTAVKITSTTVLIVGANESAGFQVGKTVTYVSVSGTTITATQSVLTNGFIGTASSSYRTSLVMLSSTTFLLWESQGNGSGYAYARVLTLSGTAVSESSYSQVNLGSNTGSSHTMYHSYVKTWGTDITLVATNGSGGSAYYVWIAPAGSSTFEVYRDATLLGGTNTLTAPFLDAAVTLNAALGGKEAYLSIKNTTGSTRGFQLTEVMFKVS